MIDTVRVVLEESQILKEHYSKRYCWKKQCEELIARLWKMVYGKISLFLLSSACYEIIDLFVVLNSKGRVYNSLADSQIPLISNE